MQTLKMDFQSQSAPPVVPVMQFDAQSRFIGITLYNGGVPYEVPEGASYTVQYRGPGANNMGWYDTITLSSGTRKAVIVDSASKNVVTLELAEQALRVNGNLFVNLCVVTNTGYMLKTFPILCRVTGAAFPDTVAVQSFFYVTGITSEQWLAYVTACQDAQKRAEDAAAKFVTDPTLSLSGKAADAAKVGEAVNAESERAKGAESQLKLTYKCNTSDIIISDDKPKVNGIEEHEEIIYLNPTATNALFVAKSINEFIEKKVNDSNLKEVETDQTTTSYKFVVNNVENFPDVYREVIVKTNKNTDYKLEFTMDIPGLSQVASRLYVFGESTTELIKLSGDLNSGKHTMSFNSGNNTFIRIRIYPLLSRLNYDVTVLFSNIMLYNASYENVKYCKPYNCSFTISEKGFFKVLLSDKMTLSLSSGNIHKTEKKLNIVCFGDSITGAFTDKDRDYPFILGKMLGAKTYNVGFGGCRMGKHPTDKYNNFCMYKLADAIYNNDFSAQEADTTGAETYPLRLETLKNIDFSNVDIVTIAYGTNDWGGGYETVKPIDNKENAYDTNNFYGATRYSIKRLLEKYPHLKIIIVSPYYRYKPETGEDSDTFKPNTNPNYSLLDYVNALEVSSNDMKVPFVNMYNSMGVNKFNRENYFDGTDGVHFNANGMKLLASRLGAFIKATYLI